MLAPRLYGCALVHPIIREFGHKDRRMHQGASLQVDGQLLM